VKGNDSRFGLKIAHRDASTGVVIGLQCRFCIAFGREEKVGSKRKPASTVQGWEAPFRYDNIEKHLRKQHPSQWDLYSALGSSVAERDSFFNEAPAAGVFKNSIKAHFASESLGAEPQKVYDIEKGIVETIVGEMMFNPDDDVDSDAEDNDARMEEQHNPGFGSQAELQALLRQRGASVITARDRALSIFKRVSDSEEEDDEDYSYSVTIPKSKTTVFGLVVRYVSCGTSFRMASNIIGCTYDVLANPGLRICSRDDVSNFIRVVCAVNLQRIARHLRRSWAFSIALDSATHQSTSYLDLRFRIFVPEFNNIINLHGCALPMFDRHTGEVMFTMVNSFLSILCPDWTIRLLGVTSDGARNMTGRVAGVVTRLDNAMHDACQLTRIWCGAHQLDLVMEHIMSNVVKERFFSILTGFITHLTRQLNLIAEMKTTCPRVVNRWLSTEKVILWFKLHRPQLLAHIEAKQPASAPPRLWWVALLAMHHFTTRTAITFRSVQGLTTLADQQQAALNDLINNFIVDVGVTGPLTAEFIAALDPSTHAISGRYAVAFASVQEFLCGLATWVDTLIHESSESDQNDLYRDISLVYVTACNRIDEISIFRDQNNNPCADPNSLPPVLPQEIVKVSAANFIRKIRQHAFRLEHQYTAAQIDVIADEHKTLLYAYQSEPVLKQGIDSLSSRSCFKDGWSLLASRLPNLMEYCGVVATLFPGTSTVESDFSILRWEKDCFRKGLSDFGLEGVLQAKQFLFIEQFEQ
jgi:branched-subunit amino acid transport protein